MSWLVLCALVACTTSFVVREHRRDSAGLDLDGLVIAGALVLAVLGLLATGLAWAGWLKPTIVSLSLTVVAAVAWPWRRPPQPWFRRWRWQHGLALLVIVGGVALRLPAMIYPLGGRDQGTYLLRAREVARTGELVHHDHRLSTASQDLGTRPGPQDILGLYPIENDPWRDGIYEGAYRPGFYLADRENGTVTPQFLHLHPLLLAVANLALGPGLEPAVITLEAALALLAMWVAARRFLASTLGAFLATGLYALTPLVVWVHRNTLSETLTGLLILASLVAFLRPAPRGPSWLAGAFLLAATAWVRGNGWLTAPIVLVLISLQPSRGRLGSRYVFGLVVMGSVLVHLSTSFPYVHDELQRQFPALLRDGPWPLASAAIVGMLIWMALDRGLARLLSGDRPTLAIVIERAPAWLAVVLVASFGAYVGVRAQAPSLPASRLDPLAPLLGWPVLGAAIAGMLIAARNRLVWSQRNTWLVALTATAVATVAIYVPRNLPEAGLYYYGRYLVPELVPAACLLAAAAVVALDRAVRRRHDIVGGGIAMAVVLLTTSAWSLVRHPITRLQEFEGADPMMTWLAERLPDDAVLIAGGEGWHRGHTFNQVGGALALAHGRQVLPYRTREAAYATLHELLIGAPEAHGTPPPPVYLLINEVTRARPLDEDGLVHQAAVDPGLFAPFRATQIGLLEMILHRLTPVAGTLPIRVSRDQLRLALLRVNVDPTLEQSIVSWRFRHGQVVGPAGLGLDDFEWRQGRLCLGPRSKVTFPSDWEGPRDLVVVVGPDSGSSSHQWRIHAEGRRLRTLPPKTTPYEQETLGPWTLRSSPKTLRLRGAQPTTVSPCAHGSLSELRVLPIDRPRLPSDRIEWAVTLVPRGDLGHPYAKTSWVGGRGLSRFRTGIRPPVEIDGLSLVLRPGRALEFPPFAIPEDGGLGIDLVLTLTRTDVSPQSRIAIWADDRLLGHIDPPDRTGRAWQSPSLTWPTQSAVASMRLSLENGEETNEVAVRDVALFSRQRSIPSTLVHP